jgi:hypothetical protein
VVKLKKGIFTADGTWKIIKNWSCSYDGEGRLNFIRIRQIKTIWNRLKILKTQFGKTLAFWNGSEKINWDSTPIKNRGLERNI